MDSKVKYIGNYLLDKTLGQGNFGKVKLATHLLTGEHVAVKIISKSKLTDICDKQRLYREIRVMKLLNHQNIVNLFEVIDTPKHIYMVMEYANGGELFDYIIAHEHVEENKARVFFRQIVSGVDYCHRMDIIHRDLKPENLLLDQNGNIKIIDFGFTNHLKPDSLLETFCGSYSYAAPEMIAHRPYLGPEVDIWSLGVILFALLTGELPFDSSDVNRLYLQMKRQDYSFPEELEISREARYLLRRMLDPTPQRRATMEDIRNHPWLNKGFPGPPEQTNLFGTQVDQINENVIAELVDMGFDGETATQALKKGEHNKVTATYRLLLEKQKRNPNFTTKNTHRKGTSTTAPAGSPSAATPAQTNGTTPTATSSATGSEKSSVGTPASGSKATTAPSVTTSSQASNAPSTSQPNGAAPTPSPSDQAAEKQSALQWLEQIQEVLQSSRHGAVEIKDEILAKVMFVIKNPENGLIQDHYWRGKLHRQCIIGCEIVDWMMRTMALSLRECVKLGQVMFDRAFVLPVVENDPVFRDEEFLYRFPTVQQRVERLKQLQKKHQKGPTGKPGAGTLSGSTESELAQQNAKLISQVASERQKHAEVASKLRNARINIADLQKQIQDVKSKVNSLNAELAVYQQKSQDNSQSDSLEHLKRANKDLLARVAAKDSLLATKDELISSLQSQIASFLQDQPSLQDPPPSSHSDSTSSSSTTSVSISQSSFEADVSNVAEGGFRKIFKFGTKPTGKTQNNGSSIDPHQDLDESHVEHLRLYIRKLEKFEIKRRLAETGSIEPVSNLSEAEQLLSPLNHLDENPIPVEGLTTLRRISLAINKPENMLANSLPYGEKMYRLFNAHEAVDWLMRNFFLSQKHSVILCELLLRQKLIKPVQTSDTYFEDKDAMYGITDESGELVPITTQNESPSSPSKSKVRSASSSTNKEQDGYQEDKLCSNCLTTETTMWYGPSKDYGLLCSECFRHWRSSGGTHRPVSEQIRKKRSKLKIQNESTRKATRVFGGKSTSTIPVRSIKSGAFNAYRRCSMKAPKIIRTIQTSLSKQKVAYKLNGFAFMCNKGDITFEIEVCFLQELASNGVRLKRFTGDTFKYKKIVKTVLAKLKA